MSGTKKKKKILHIQILQLIVGVTVILANMPAGLIHKFTIIIALLKKKSMGVQGETLEWTPWKTERTNFG